MAAQFKSCSEPGCNKNAHYKSGGSKGLCCAHYTALYRSRGPSGRTPMGEPLAWLMAAIRDPGQECIRWPYAASANGYGRVRVNGRMESAHRVACEAYHGPAPDGKSHAAHDCGNGHLGCINPLHLSWASPAENIADKERHGTKQFGEAHHRAKLSEADVRKIRSLKGRMTQFQIAEIFSVSESAVSLIHTRRNWAWLD